MKVIGRDKITSFIDADSNAKQLLQCWLCEVEDALWKDSKEITTRYRGADLLADNRVIFHFFSGNFKLLARIVIGAGIVIIEKIGSVADYSKWNLR